MLSVLQMICTLTLAWLAIFVQAAGPGVQWWLGAQPDLLPALMVHAALRTSLVNVCLLALWGGLLLDTVSANPPGISSLPLFAVGLGLHLRRDLILRDQPFAQFMMGLMAGAAVPALTVVLLLSLGRQPVLGWSSLLPWSGLALSSGIATPLFFRLFRVLEGWFAHRRPGSVPFRPDREIRRGRY